MRLSFEPANAGWVSPHGIRLGQSLSRFAVKIETLMKSVGSKPGVQHHAHSRVSFLYHKIITLDRQILIILFLNLSMMLIKHHSNPVICYPNLTYKKSTINSFLLWIYSVNSPWERYGLPNMVNTTQP